MNVLKFFTSTLAIAALVLPFTSCSDDDDNNGKEAIDVLCGDYALFAWSSAESDEKPDYTVDEEKPVKLKRLAADAVEISFNDGKEVYKISDIKESDEQDPLMTSLGGFMYESLTVTVVKSEIIDAQSAKGEAYFNFMEKYNGSTLNFEVTDKNGSSIEFMAVQNTLAAIIKMLS